MKKKLSSISLMLVLMLSMLSVTAWATDGTSATKDVASVTINKTTTNYTSLQDAVNAARTATSSVTITLLDNVTINETLDLTGVTKLTNIVLNAKTLTANNCTALKIGGNGTINIKGIAGTTHGEIQATGNNSYAVEYVGTGKLVFQMYPTIKGGLKNSNNGTIQITNGTYTGNIKNEANGTITINGGTFEGDIVNAGGGELSFKKSGDYAIKHTGELNNTENGTISLKWGKFSKEPNEAFLPDFFVATKGTDNYWEVSNMTPAMALAEGYVACSLRYVESKAPYSTIAYYKTLNEAASKTNSVYLICDINLGSSGFEFNFGTTPQSRELILDGHAYTGSIKEAMVTKKATTTINGNTQSSKTETGRGTAKINNLDILSTLKVIKNADVTLTTGSATGIDVDKTSTLTINGGTYTGTVKVADGGKLSITGGTYDVDVTKYCAEGYIANKDSSTGKYIVEEIPETVSNLEVDESTRSGEAEVKVGDGVAESDTATATAIAQSVTASNLNKAAKNITISSDDKKNVVQKLVAAGQVKLDENGDVVSYDGSTEDVKITIIKETYLEVEVTGLTTNGSTGNELKFDITPKYNLLATTDITNPSKTVTVSTGNTLTVNENTKVVVKLPENFATSGDKLLIKHDKSDKTVEYYTGTVSADEQGALYVSFTTRGFSPFTVSTAYAASIGEGEAMQVYPSLQAAVDAAKNGDIIKLHKDGEKATVKRTIKFIVDPSKGDTQESYKYTINLGDGCTRKATDNVNEWNIVYTAPKSPVTADNSELGLFAVVGLISVAAVALILNRKRSM